MKLAIVIPAYRTQRELEQVLEKIPVEQSTSTIVVDDGSDPALYVNDTVKLFRHDSNKGYGAAQKSAFRQVLHWEMDIVLLVHGDDQYDAKLLMENAGNLGSSDILLGSRMLYKEGRDIPIWRRYGNRFLTKVANIRCSSKCTDLHTGARIYSKKFLQEVPFDDFSDDFLFDQQMLLWALANSKSIVEVPFPAKYDETVSSISFLKAVQYGFGCLSEIYD